jgi:hypothetical protein
MCTEIPVRYLWQFTQAALGSYQFLINGIEASTIAYRLHLLEQRAGVEPTVASRPLCNLM